MRLFLFFIILFLTALSCQSDHHAEKFIVDRNLPSHDTIRLLSKYPELKLYNNEVVESKIRTAFIIQTASFFDINHSERSILFSDYKCKAVYQDDTLTVKLNNDNGYFGNGILVKVFNNRFYIKDIDPKTIKNEEKFKKTKIISQKLILNTSKFNKNDSIYGYIDYKCNLDSLVAKHFKGYFKAIIQ